MHRGTDRYLYQECKAVGDKKSDGGGLYLHIKAKSKLWRMAYRIHGQQKTLYIGAYPAVSLVQARAARQNSDHYRDR